MTSTASRWLREAEENPLALPEPSVAFVSDVRARYTDASLDTGSYHEFAEDYFPPRNAMQWFWDQYTINDRRRGEITASPPRADIDELRGLPPALVITGEADVLRDEGRRTRIKPAKLAFQ